MQAISNLIAGSTSRVLGLRFSYGTLGSLTVRRRSPMLSYCLREVHTIPVTDHTCVPWHDFDFDIRQLEKDVGTLSDQKLSLRLA